MKRTPISTVASRGEQTQDAASLVHYLSRERRETAIVDGTATSEDFVADLRLQRERRQRERASKQQQLLQQGGSTNGTTPAGSAAASSTDSFPSARRWEGDVTCAEQTHILSQLCCGWCRAHDA